MQDKIEPQHRPERPQPKFKQPSPQAYGGGAVLYDISIFEFRKIVTYSANHNR